MGSSVEPTWRKNIEMANMNTFAGVTNLSAQGRSTRRVLPMVAGEGVVWILKNLN